MQTFPPPPPPLPNFNSLALPGQTCLSLWPDKPCEWNRPALLHVCTRGDQHNAQEDNGLGSGLCDQKYPPTPLASTWAQPCKINGRPKRSESAPGLLTVGAAPVWGHISPQAPHWRLRTALSCQPQRTAGLVVRHGCRRMGSVPWALTAAWVWAACDALLRTPQTPPRGYDCAHIVRCRRLDFCCPRRSEPFQGGQCCVALCPVECPPRGPERRAHTGTVSRAGCRDHLQAWLVWWYRDPAPCCGPFACCRWL